MGGSPGFLALDFHRQNNLKAFPCYLMTVSGRTIARADRQFGQRRDSNTQKTLSRGRSFGRLTDWQQAATCCRSARFSAAAARPRMNALRNRKMDRTMPMIRCSGTRQMGNRSGMSQPRQTAGDAISPCPPQNPQFWIFPTLKNRLS